MGRQQSGLKPEDLPVTVDVCPRDWDAGGHPCSYPKNKRARSCKTPARAVAHFVFGVTPRESEREVYMVRFKTGLVLCLLTLVSAWSAPPAAAVIIDSGGNQELAVESWAGTGSNESYLVVDLSATGGGSYAFGYRWDGVTSGIQMIQDIDAAGDLDVTTVTFGTVAPTDPNFGGDPNIFIDNFFYNGEMGDTSLFWAYSLGTLNDPAVDWTGASTGASL